MHRFLALATVFGLCFVLIGQASAAKPPLTAAQLQVQLVLAKGRVSTAQANARAQKARADSLGKSLVKANNSLTVQAAADAAALAAMKTDRDAQATALATTNAALTAAQANAAAIQASVTGLQAALAGNVSQMTYPTLWSLLGSISARFSQLGGTTYTTSVFTGSSYSDYDFSWFHF